MTEVAQSTGASAAARGLSPFRASLYRFTRNRLAVVSLVVLVLIILACFVAPFFMPFSVEDADFDNISAPIDLLSLHPFGTDDLGRDLLLRVLDGGRVSLALGFVGALASVAISVVYGAAAGYLGGRVDDLMMRFVDILLSVPFMFLVIMINVSLGDLLGMKNVSLFIAVVITLWLTPAVIARGQAVSLRNREFVEAARAGGMSSWQIICQHVAPNSVNVVIVYSSLLVLEAILTESFLSFLGIGVQAPAASWGTLINSGADNLETDPRLLLLPGAFLALTLFCLNYITDGLRDAFDPNER
ncbi:ABC transporter permease [Dongia rigui]|uniref:Oligopeptide transport system permease protein OppC n=1 Tax=Dongia rigui TaxID=940149 RepID=A0ABU5DWA6_9PROT|nr:ABC transporter permease subunit [Dongia rigui]MDY0871220.1 ABC transporter permease subunit [Dongia rigui]